MLSAVQQPVCERSAVCRGMHFLKSSIGVLAVSLARNRELLIRLAGRELAARFRGSVLGLSWTVLTPLLLAAVYTFVFTNVFKMRWAGADETHAAMM